MIGKVRIGVEFLNFALVRVPEAIVEPSPADITALLKKLAAGYREAAPTWNRA